MNKISLLLILPFLLCSAFSGICTPLSDADKEYIERGKRRLTELLRQNALNDAAGKSHLNRYVFSLSESRLTFEEGNVKNRVSKSGYAFVSPATVNELNVYLHELAEGGLYLYAGLDGRRFEVQKSGTAHLSGERKDITDEIKLLNNAIYKDFVMKEDTITNRRAFVSIHPILRYYISDLKQEPSKKDSVQRLYYKHVIHNPIAHNGIGPLIVETGNEISIRKKSSDQDVLYFVKTIGELFRTYEPVEDELICDEETKNKIREKYKNHPYFQEENYLYRVVNENPCVMLNVRRFNDLPSHLYSTGHAVRFTDEWLINDTSDELEEQWESTVNAFSAVLKEKVNKSSLIATLADGTNPEFKYLYDGMNELDAESIELEEKLELYKIEATEEGGYFNSPSEIYFIRKEINFFLPAGKYEEFLQAVLERTPEFDKERMTLILMPTFVSVQFPISVDGVDENPHVFFLSEGYNDDTIIYPEVEGGFNEMVSAIFTSFKKPYTKFIYMVNIKGEVASIETAKLERSGTDNLLELFLYVDTNLSIKTSFYNLRNYLNTINKNQSHFHQVQALNEKYWLLQEVEQQIEDGTYEPNFQWVQHNVKESYIRNFKEHYFEWYLSKKYDEMAEEKLDFPVKTEPIPEDVRINALEGDAVYELLDFASLASGFVGGDVVFDAMIAIYCYEKGEIDCAVQYGAQTFAPKVLETAAIASIRAFAFVKKLSKVSDEVVASLKHALGIADDAFVREMVAKNPAIMILVDLSDQSALNAVKNMDGDMRRAFLTDLTRTHANYSENLLKDHVTELNDEVIEVWKVLHENNNIHKKLDYNFLTQNAGKSTDEILEALTLSNSRNADLIAKLLDEASDYYCPPCADAVRARGLIRYNTLKNLDNPAFSEESERLAKALAVRYLNRIPNEEFPSYIKRIEQLVDHNVFETHHLLPVNLFESSEGFRNYFKYFPDASQRLSFNASDDLTNAILLEKFSGGVGVHASHPEYEKKLRDYLDERWNNHLRNNDYDKLEAALAMHEDIIKLNNTLKEKLIKHSIEGEVKVNALFNEVKDIL